MLYLELQLHPLQPDLSPHFPSHWAQPVPTLGHIDTSAECTVTKKIEKYSQLRENSSWGGFGGWDTYYHSSGWWGLTEKTYNSEWIRTGLIYLQRSCPGLTPQCSTVLSPGVCFHNQHFCSQILKTENIWISLFLERCSPGSVWGAGFNDNYRRSECKVLVDRSSRIFPPWSPGGEENSAVPAEVEVSLKVSPLVIWSSPTPTHIFRLCIKYFQTL